MDKTLDFVQKSIKAEPYLEGSCNKGDGNNIAQHHDPEEVEFVSAQCLEWRIVNFTVQKRVKTNPPVSVMASFAVELLQNLLD